MITSHLRGNLIIYSDGAWIYPDGSKADDSRPCARCGRYPNADGSDACIGHIPGATAACCGHGVEKPYVKY